MSKRTDDLLARLEGYSAQQLRRLLVEQLTERKLGLRWELDAIKRDWALNANRVLPRRVPELDCLPADKADSTRVQNLIIEGDNFDALRLLRVLSETSFD